MAQVHFHQIHDERIQHIFRTTLARYQFDPKIQVILQATRLKGSTMQAQPVFRFSSLWNGLDAYRIKLATYVRDSDELLVRELEDDILMGWFAHELGHVADYQAYSLLGMIGYGLRYVFSKKFRQSVEHRADEIAIEHGFHQEILTTKTFLFTHEGIAVAYRNKMKRYYMSIAELEERIQKTTLIDPVD